MIGERVPNGAESQLVAGLALLEKREDTLGALPLSGVEVKPGKCGLVVGPRSCHRSVSTRATAAGTPGTTNRILSRARQRWAITVSSGKYPRWIVAGNSTLSFGMAGFHSSNLRKSKWHLAIRSSASLLAANAA